MSVMDLYVKGITHLARSFVSIMEFAFDKKSIELDIELRGKKSDTNNLAKDWSNVGYDLRKSMVKYGRQS